MKREYGGEGKKNIDQSSTIDLVEPQSSQFYCAQQNFSTEVGMYQLIVKWNVNEHASSLLYLNKQD